MIKIVAHGPLTMFDNSSDGFYYFGLNLYSSGVHSTTHSEFTKTRYVGESTDYYGNEYQFIATGDFKNWYNSGDYSQAGTINTLSVYLNGALMLNITELGYVQNPNMYGSQDISDALFGNGDLGAALQLYLVNKPLTVNGSNFGDQLLGSSKVDTIHGLGGNDMIKTGAGNDKLYGEVGNDKLYGEVGNDFIFGDVGDDILVGSAGNDILRGGRGTDNYYGGAGADDFVFKSLGEIGKGTTRDIVRDFSHSHGDDIDLSIIDANTLKTGIQDFVWIGTKAFTGVAGQIHQVGKIISGDVNADKVADFELNITNGEILYASDFIF